jgi:hypothetical protein
MSRDKATAALGAAIRSGDIVAVQRILANAPELASSPVLSEYAISAVDLGFF